MEISGYHFGAADIEEQFEQGAVTFARWFAKMMDANGWSHPKLVELAKIATDGKGWVWSSQIASLRKGQLKSPGPRSIASLAYLMYEIDAYQKGTQDEHSPDFSKQDQFIKTAVILRDDDDNPASVGYLFEVFCGWRQPPEGTARRDFTDEQAAVVSMNAGKHVRRLVTADRLDLIEAMPRLVRSFSNDKEGQEKFRKVVLGEDVWLNVELDHSVTCLSHMLTKVFKEERKSEELLNDLLK